MQPEVADIERILVVNRASIGDVVLAVPATRALKQRFPAARLAMLTAPPAAAILEMNPYVDDALLYDERGEHRGLSGLIAIVNMLRRGRFDLAVCLSDSWRDAFAVWAAGIRCRVGYDRTPDSLFLTHAAPPEADRVRHRAMQQLEALRPLGIFTEDISLTLRPDEKTEQIIDTTFFLASARPKVAFFPLNCERPQGNPSAAKAQEIAAALETFTDVYLIGGLAEQAALQELAERVGLPPERILAGRLNLKEGAALLRHMSLLLSVEAGVMYMAQALGVPVVALFGPNNSQVYGPCGNRDAALTHRLACAPCGGRTACERNNCIEEIPLEEIVASVRERIAAGENEH